MLERKQESYLACLVISASEQEVKRVSSTAHWLLLGVVGTEQLYIWAYVTVSAVQCKIIITSMPVEAHSRSTLSSLISPSVAFETVLVLVWVIIPYSPARQLRSASDTRTFVTPRVSKHKNIWWKIFFLCWPICLEQFASNTPPLWFYLLFQSRPQDAPV